MNSIGSSKYYFLRSLYQYEVNSSDVQHKEMLDKEYQQVLKTFKQKRDAIQKVQGRISLLEQIFAAETSKESDKLQMVQVLEAKCDAIKREIDNQALKKERALTMARKACKQVRKITGSTERTAEELEIFTKTAKEVGTLALKDLEKLSNSHPELGLDISKIMQSQNLQPISRSVSRASSMASFATYSTTSSGRHFVLNGAPAAETTIPERSNEVQLKNSASSTPKSAGSQKLSTKNLGGILIIT